MARQTGQAMTEYLVVLGVTGAVLLAASADVNSIFKSIGDSYKTYSTEINRVQWYEDVEPQIFDKVPETDPDDGTPIPAPPIDETPPDQLAMFSQVFDSEGNLLGTFERNQLIDAKGNVLATWVSTSLEAGHFVDASGEVVYPGFSFTSVPMGADGKPAVLQALMRNDQVVGFAYFENGKYYNAVTGRVLAAQPTGVAPVPTREVYMLDEAGKAVVIGYEARGFIYHQSTSNNNETFTDEVTKKGELVGMRFEDPEVAKKWTHTCVVRALDWVSSELKINPDPGVRTEIPATETSQVSEPPTAGGFLKTGDGTCAGRWLVEQSAGQWWLTGQ